MQRTAYCSLRYVYADMAEFMLLERKLKMRQTLDDA